MSFGVMFDPHVFIFDFGSEKAQEMGFALADGKTVEIDHETYVPLSARYDPKDDTIAFRAELVLFHSA